MQTEYLFKNLINYDQFDVHITGNPQITHFYKDLKHLDFKRHTNFQYGMINLEEINGAYETTLDTINYVTILTDNVNNIMCINFILPSTNEIISLSINRLKIIDITIRKTIFQIGNKYMIKIPLANFINFTHNYNIICTEFLNLFQQKLKIVIVRSPQINSQIEVKIYGCVLDSYERKTFIDQIHTHKYSKIINLQIEHNCNSEQTLFTYDLKNYLFAKSQTIIIKISSIDLIDNIILHMNDKHIKFTQDMLHMYNDTYDKIIFDVDNYCLLKIPYLISTDKPISSFLLDINTVNKCNQIFLYMLTDVELKITEFKPLIVFNNSFCTYVQHYQTNANSVDNTVNIDVNQMHLKEIIISCTKDGVYVKPINNFRFNFHDSYTNYTDTDCELYQKMHHEKLNENIYTIGFALDPNHHYSTGCVNIKKINFIYYALEYDFKMDVYLVGHKINI